MTQTKINLNKLDFFLVNCPMIIVILLQQFKIITLFQKKNHEVL